MANNYCNIPMALPFRFVKAGVDASVNFDDDWACNQIRSHQRKVYYFQKWIKSKTTKLQVESTIAPQDLKAYNVAMVVAKSFEWTAVFDSGTYKIYECTVDMSDQPDGKYWFYHEVKDFVSIDWKWISNPIDLKAAWPNVRELRYRNTKNANGMAWTTGIECSFFVECDIPPNTLDPARDRSAYVNQIVDTSSLKGTPSRVFKFYVGDQHGVAPWVVDLLNDIFCCDTIYYEGKQYQSTDGSKWEKTSFDTYPLMWCSIDVTDRFNRRVSQQSSTDLGEGGVIVVSQINTNFFGPDSPVIVTEYQQD